MFQLFCSSIFSPGHWPIIFSNIYSHHHIACSASLQLSHPRCRTAFAVRVDRPPLASQSPPRRLMLPAAFALDVPRPPIPVRVVALRVLPLTRQLALAPPAAPPASKCRLTEKIAAARLAVLALTVPSAHALRAAPLPTLPTAHVQPVPPRPMLLDARAPLAPVFPNKRNVGSWKIMSMRQLSLSRVIENEI